MNTFLNMPTQALAIAGRLWLDDNGITMSDTEIHTFHTKHVAPFAKLGVALSGDDMLALLRAYMVKQSPLTEEEIRALTTKTAKDGQNRTNAQPY